MIKSVKNAFILFLFALVMLATSCTQVSKKDIEMIPLFSNNMVLQQQQNIPIWGTASTNSKVEVTFRNQTVKTKSDENGKWKVVLQPENAGLNETLTIKNGKNIKTFSNVAVGEVWLASGQSNMEVPLVNNWGPIHNGDQEAANANYPNLRLFFVNRNTTVVPVDTISSDGWKECTPETVKNFSAVGYFFGRELLNNLQVPIGIIQSAWGGTVAEAWTSAESLSLLNDFAGDVEKMKLLPADLEGQQNAYTEDDLKMHAEMAEADPGIEGNDTIFAAIGFDDSKWESMNLPGLWENTPFGAFDGTVWFRKHVTINAKHEGKAMQLHVAPSDDLDEAWVNGVKVGQSAMWGEPRIYNIASGVIKNGENVITLRVSDFQGAGGFNGEPKHFALTDDANFNLNLSGEWLIHAGYNNLDIKTKPFKPGEPNRITTLFNGMINPLIPYAFKGVIWYQGESNAGKAWQYRELFQTMIKDWRGKWNNGDFPFYLVQLANHMKRNEEPVEDMWAELREAQTLAMKLPNVGMAVAIEIGEADNIHPGNKQDVGKRLSLWALNKTYGKDIPFSGPLYKDFTVADGKITINFDNAYGGLKTSDSKAPVGFAIAGDDGKFVWANAVIENNSVVVFSPKVKNPVAVRYAWSANPACNLINSENLPASPFRTDNFDPITK